ncbi:MAG: hypothetical protein ACOYN0_15225 [Phycisphaerales bacterium]
MDGDYSHGVYVAAEREWERMSADEKADKVAAVEADVEEFRGFLTPLAVVFDFGIFGTLWTIASVLSCVKAASATNEPKEEEARVDAGGLAGVMTPGGLRGLPPPQAESPSESVLPGMPPPPPGQGPLGRIGDKRDPGQRDRAAA